MNQIDSNMPLDDMEHCIVGYKVLAHILAYFYLYGFYLRSFDIDVIIIVNMLLARKVMYKVWLYFTN